jgi:hypothetical protein
VFEHRYFGSSKPFGVADPLDDLDAFQYLTLDNVMQDVVNFVDSLRANLTGGQDSKVIVTGCSYPGWLAGIYRQNHPDTFWGAVASGAPIEAWLTDEDQSRIADYTNLVNNIYQEESLEAWENIRAAYTALNDAITAGRYDELQKAFNTCDMQDNTTTALLPIYGGSVHGLASQYNTHYVHFNPIADPLDKVIDIALSTEQNDPLQLINRTIWAWFEPLTYPV